MNIKEKIIEIIKESSIEDSIQEETPLKALGITSMEYVKILVNIEDEFDIYFDDEALNYPEDICVIDLIKQTQAIIKG